MTVPWQMYTKLKVQTFDRETNMSEFPTIATVHFDLLFLAESEETLGFEWNFIKKKLLIHSKIEKYTPKTFFNENFERKTCCSKVQIFRFGQNVQMTPNMLPIYMNLYIWQRSRTFQSVQVIYKLNLYRPFANSAPVTDIDSTYTTQFTIYLQIEWQMIVVWIILTGFFLVWKVCKVPIVKTSHLKKKKMMISALNA